MATTIHEPPKIRREQNASRVVTSDNGGWRSLVPTDGDSQKIEKHSPPPASTGIWVGIAAIGMTFAAFTSALIVRKGSSNDWQTLTLPPVLYLNTLMLLASSTTLEISRKRIATYTGGLKAQVVNPARWLYVTLFLGLVFVAGQYLAWRQLRSQGIFLATNPSSSFFYLLTAVHALHVGGGLGGLILVIRRLSKSVLRRSTLDTASLYWHFMGVLWLYLLLLFWMKV